MCRLTVDLIDLQLKVAPQVAQAVKNLPPVQETWVRSLSQEDLLEKEIATHSSILAWRIPWTEEPGSYSPWGGKESDMTKWLQFHFHFIQYKPDQLIRSIRRCSPVLAFQDFMQLFSFTYLSLSWVCKFNHISFLSFYFSRSSMVSFIIMDFLQLHYLFLVV